MKVFFYTFSRILAFFFACLFFLTFVVIILNLIDGSDNSDFSYLKGDKKSQDIIAILNLNGPILSDINNSNRFSILNSSEVIYPFQIQEYLKQLQKLKISGLIVSINSPGGSVSGSDSIFEIFKEFKNSTKIPLYFHTTDMLASGGYWVSLSGDKIFANYGALIGSIGVKGPDWIYYNSPTSLSSGFFGNSVESPKGIKLFTNTAGISKDILNPFREPNKKEIKQLQEMVNKIYNDFVSLVSSNRKIEIPLIKNEIGAMIFNTHQAKQNFLIDDQKNIDEAINFMTLELGLVTKKIIINVKNKKFKLANLDIFSDMIKENIFLEKRDIIKNKFCNNLKNEFSVVLSHSFNANC